MNLMHGKLKMLDCALGLDFVQYAARHNNVTQMAYFQINLTIFEGNFVLKKKKYRNCSKFEK